MIFINAYLPMPVVRDLDYEWNLEEPELSNHLDNGGRQPRTRPGGVWPWELSDEMAQHLINEMPQTWYPDLPIDLDCFVIMDEEQEDYMLTWAKYHSPSDARVILWMRTLRVTMDLEDLLWRLYR